MPYMKNILIVYDWMYFIKRAFINFINFFLVFYSDINVDLNLVFFFELICDLDYVLSKSRN